MFNANQESGIAKNIRIIEWLKADLLTSLSALFKGMLRGGEEQLLDALASLIITCYVLGRRLGISFSRLDLTLESKLHKNIEENHELEKTYKDLSLLLTYMADKKR